MSLLFNPQCRTGTSTEACASVQGAKIQNIFESNSLFVEKLIINGRKMVGRDFFTSFLESKNTADLAF